MPGGKLQLFGTMHTEDLTAMPNVAAERFAAAHTVAFEADVDNMNVAKLLSVAMLPLTQSLDELIGPEAWQRLKDYLGGTIPPALLRRARPWFAVSLILVKVSGVQASTQTMDKALLGQGRSGNKTVRFLETVDEQLAMLDKTLDAATLVALLAVLEQLPPMFQAMADAYRSGDITTLERVVAQTDKRWGGADQKMQGVFGTRNERWIPFLEKLASQGGAFVVVGAGHLPGKDGLVALLRARGYRVSRVPAGAH